MTAPLDKRWFTEFRSNIVAITTNYYFRSRRKTVEEQRKKFLANEIRNPSFEYPRLNAHYFIKRRDSLARLRQQIFKEETHPVVRQAYLWSIDETLDQINLLLAATNKDMGKFRHFTESTFGTPSPEIFKWTIQSLHDLCADSMVSSDTALKEAAEQLKSHLPTFAGNSAIFIPSQPLVKKVFVSVLKQLGSLIEIPQKAHDWKGEELRLLFQEKLQGAKLYDWSAVLVEDQYYISVEKNHKEVRLPEQRGFSSEDVRSLLAHEIGVHVLRRVNGIKSKLLLLGMGLDRYYRGEEGLATLYEEALYGSFINTIRPQRYLAIGLTYGLDGQRRDFREVFEIMVHYFRHDLLLSSPPSQELEEHAILHAWETCRRIFRGTTGSEPGVCLTKDIIYQEGNIQIWEALAEHPKELRRLLIGKYDPANEHHRWILDSLGY
ncbi:MAG: DUF1704 domain-containing protein [Candidatus Andersenbacteria bacterium]|nr:DUF1704 domain-containing protein [Candidatus Andersenbacteria bacterium]MBI3250283.1 DUF1704 domain-containing protein [Candidatus Andersenbacteria bacterium]